MNKVSKRKITERCELCSRLTIKAPERGHVDHVLVSLLLFLNKFYIFSSAFISGLEQVSFRCFAQDF